MQVHVSRRLEARTPDAKVPAAKWIVIGLERIED